MLEFANDMTEEGFQAGLKKYGKENLLFKETLWPDFSATPSPMDQLIGDWNIRSTVGKGTFGTVNVAKNVSTGVSAAAKRLVRNSGKDHQKIMGEIDLLKPLPSNVDIVTLFMSNNLLTKFPAPAPQISRYIF